MKKLLLTIATVATILFSTNNANASVPDELDQQQTTGSFGVYIRNNADIVETGQSFTPSITGELHSIVVRPFSLNLTPTAQYFITIYSGEGFAGAVLLNNFEIPDANGWQVDVDAEINLPDGINIVSGQKYTFKLSTSEGEMFFYSSQFNPYAGGVLAYTENGPYIVAATHDFYFETYVIPAAGPTTQLSSSCGATGLLKSNYIYANAIPGAGKYKFTFSNGQSFTTGNYLPKMLLSNVSGLQYGQTYNVTVQAYVGGVLTTAGASCSIEMAAFPTTQLSTLSCDATGLTPTSTIYCNGVAGATKYQFTFSNGAVFTTGNDAPKMILSNLTSLQYGQTYGVTVKAYVGSVWGTDGAPCNITMAAAPTSQLLTCGQSVTATSILYANRVPGGYRYKFNVTDGGTYTRSFTTGNDFPQTSLTNFRGLVNGTMYMVTVQAYVGGVWGDPGNPCPIFVGGMSRAANTEEVAVVENNNEIISQEVVEVISEEVKTAPAVEETSAINSAKAEFTAYPNPVSKSAILNIAFDTEEIGKVILTDVTGRIITEQNFNTNLNSVVEIDLADKKLDNGIYNLSIIGNKSTAQKTIIIAE